MYPAIRVLWENAWSEFIPFLDYDVEIRRIICSTNAIESLNARYRRAVRAMSAALENWTVAARRVQFIVATLMDFLRLSGR